MKIHLYVLIAISMMLSSCHKETFNERMVRDTKEYTENQCPQRLDKYTTVDSVEYLPEKMEIVYHYTVSDELDVDSIYTDKLKAAFNEELLKSLKNSIDQKEKKDHGCTFAYKYHSSKTGKVLMECAFTQKDYK